MTEINWNNAMKNENTSMKLADAEVGVEHRVTFHSVFQTDSGSIGANVSSPTLDGDVLWLTGKYGPSNGLYSLMKAAGCEMPLSPGVKAEEEIVAGKHYTYTRVESEKSNSGYAHYWQPRELS